jgi:DNA (cytosine-5)-methyltransferase 1
LKLKHLDLFSGIGGFSLGLERTGGFETVGFCDSDKKTHLVLKKHWANVPIYDDVSTLKGSDLGTIDIITGGFPCQDLSVAGKGAGLAGARSGLWFEFHRLIKETQPKWVIAENVAVLRSRGLDQVLRSLDEIGYDAEWHCIPASAVGAPHRRDRIWIVAHPRHRGGRYDIGSGFGGDGKRENEKTIRASKTAAITGSSQTPDALAYSNGCLEANGGKCTDFKRKGDGGGVEQRGSGQDDRQGCIRGSRGCSKDDVAYSTSIGSSGQGEFEQPKYPTQIVSRETIKPEHGSVSDFWKTEPQLGRVADGIPNRLDRLKQLGNSLVPQIPEMIGYAILERERNLL